MENENSEEILQNKGQDLWAYVNDLFTEFKTGRQPYEDKAEEWWLNFLSQYQDAKTWKLKEGQNTRSRIFIKVTQQKCYIAHAKTMDALGPNVPFDFEPLENLNYGEITKDLIAEAAQFRKKYIDDYLKWIKFMDETLDDAVLDATIFPAAIIKGPILVKEKKPVVKPNIINGIQANMINPKLSPWVISTEYVDKYIFENVPFWDYYVDTNAKRSIGEIHYKRLLPQELRDLADDPGYDREEILKVIKSIETAVTSTENSENDKEQQKLGDKFTGFEKTKDGKIPVAEYSGLVPVKALRDFGAIVPEDIKDDEDVEACVTIVMNTTSVIKAQFNYYGYRPGQLFGVKKIPGSVYKNSIAGLIDDSQKMINSGCRLFIDGKAISGNGVLGINVDKIDMAKTKKLDLYPGKTYYLKGNGSIDDALQFKTIPDVTLGIKDMVQLFLQIADEESLIPKYAAGDAQSSFLNKTATGMSMIMGAANVNLKPFIKNIDEVIKGVVERLDALFSMLDIYPPQYNIPLKAVATGTISMMARELIVENMLRLLQLTQNPQDEVIVKRKEMIKSIADKLGLSKFVNTDEEIQKIEQMLAERSKGLQAKPELDISKLYPYLTRTEQAQILQSVGIMPDPSAAPMPPGAPSAPKQPMPSEINPMIPPAQQGNV